MPTNSLQKKISTTATIALVFFFISSCKHPVQLHEDRQTGARFERIGPGGGGATFIPTFSYQSPDDFLVRCDMTGSYLTKDGGRSYSQVNFDNGASCYAYDPRDPKIIYVGSTVLHRSADGGKTWTRIFPLQQDIKTETFTGDHAEYKLEAVPGSLYPDSVGRIGAVRVDPELQGGLYFTMGSFFFYSFDSGKTWKREDLHHPISYLYTGSSRLKDLVYIFCTDGIFVFDKSSQKFSSRKIPASMSPAFSFTAGVKKNTDSIVMYALHHDTSKEISGEFGYSEIWTSQDDGATWTPVADTLITNASSGVKPSFSMLVCAELDAAQAYVVTNRYLENRGGGASSYWYGAMKTNNAGGSWAWVWKGGGGSGQYGVKDGVDAANLEDAWVKQAFGGEYIRLMDAGVYPGDGNVAIVTDWYRTMKTTNGGKTWEQIYSLKNADGSYTSIGMDVTTAYGVHFDPFDSSHIAISYTDIGYHHSFDGGKGWKRSVTGVPVEWINTCYWVAFDPDVKNKMWSAWSGAHDYPRGKMTRDPKWKENGAAKGGICVSTDGGRTWKPTVDGMGTNSPSTCVVVDPRSPAGNRTLYATVYNKGVFKSVDDGKTWRLKINGIEGNTCAFDLTLGKDGELWLTVTPVPQFKNGRKSADIYSGAVFKSTDGAESWTKLHITDGFLFPNHVEVDGTDPKRLYLGCWSNITLSDLVGGDVARSAGGNRLLHSPGGILLSEDGGGSWTQIFDSTQYVYSVTADPYHQGRLYCNTFNRGAYRSDDSGKTWKKIEGYDFHWGQRILPDKNNPEKVYLTTFGSSVWHGEPVTE